MWSEQVWIIIRLAFHHNNSGHAVARPQGRFSSDDDLCGVPISSRAPARNLKDIRADRLKSRIAASTNPNTRLEAGATLRLENAGSCELMSH